VVNIRRQFDSFRETSSIVGLLGPVLIVSASIAEETGRSYIPGMRLKYIKTL
jgi:hypothetical protein